MTQTFCQLHSSLDTFIYDEVYFIIDESFIPTQALLLSPRNVSIYSAIGFVHSLTGNAEEAVDWFHKALGVDRGDTFSSTMLNCLIEELADERPPFDGKFQFIEFYLFSNDYYSKGAPIGIPQFIPKENSRLSSSSEMDETSINKDASSIGNDISMSILEDNPDPSSMSIEVDMEMTRD